MAAVSSLIIYVVEDRYTGEASAMNLIIRNVGSAVGVQVGAAVITLSPAGRPQVAAFSIAFAVAGFACLVAGAVALSVPVKRRFSRREISPSLRDIRSAGCFR
jgi:acyl-CoA synthetase (AMP-forming)/AMP-acid ligase II